MNDFTASNGIKVERDKEGGVGVSWSTPNNAGWTFHDAVESQALREFFQAEADERLGRWRWPENTDVVVVPDVDRYHDDGKRWVAVYDETKMGRSSWYCANGSERGIRGSQPLHDAAWSYFDAHPEPKPWHDAKPGEVWEITRAGSTDMAWRLESGAFMFDDESWVFAKDIKAGRRIWPEAVAS